MNKLGSTLAAMAVCVASGVADAQDAKVEIGVLSCNLAEARDAPSSAEFRDVLCSFKPKKGAEETYEGKVQGISLSVDKKTTVLWLVRGAPGMPVDIGFLQQSYAASRTAITDQMAPPLIGEPNSNVILYSMAEKEEGSASTPEKSRPTGFVIMALELKLKATSG